MGGDDRGGEGGAADGDDAASRVARSAGGDEKDLPRIIMAAAQGCGVRPPWLPLLLQ